MQVIKTEFEGLIEIIPTIYNDQRGWFYEYYKDQVFHSIGITEKFPQENISFSKKNVVRGLHFQMPPYAQAKLVSVMAGKVLDVVVDIRTGSKTFGKVYYCELDSIHRKMLMVPAGFAHGFVAQEDSIFFYKTSNLYHKESEQGIRWNDPELNIDWQVSQPIISEKDQVLPTFAELLRKSVISR
ncbi:MAG: dTDP-4-dehydrorhamnose 3,5-epimerase [Flammeovirgaceae bacterium]|nr:dTDP-4-dehydrorhamnose 3,5-epimerase [Flammeovirgaceae bacterium]